MTSHARIFFAGVGTTFVILAIGFGGGVLLATSAVQDNGSAVKRPPAFPDDCSGNPRRSSCIQGGGAAYR